MTKDPTQVKGFRILQEIAVRALDDEKFRRQLIANPKDELEAAGLEVPPGVNVFIHENTRTEIHLVLPSCPPLLPEDVNLVHVYAAHHVF